MSNPVGSQHDHNWHGYSLSHLCLPPPRCVAEAAGVLARPAFHATSASEYIDSDEVLRIKAAAVAKNFVEAQRPLLYTGAGISTAAGVRDWASNASGSIVQPRDEIPRADNGKEEPKDARERKVAVVAMAGANDDGTADSMPPAPPLHLHKPQPIPPALFVESLRPTYTHRCFAAMERVGLVWGWLQQNHDGLAQRAGFPSYRVNEVHGSWCDLDKNPIIPCYGRLRSDLFDWMLKMELHTDFVFAIGTSFSGHADDAALECAKKHMGADRAAAVSEGNERSLSSLPAATNMPVGHGLTIVSIQQTPKDSFAAIRVFAKCDDFMRLAAKAIEEFVNAHFLNGEKTPSAAPNVRLFVAEDSEQPKIFPYARAAKPVWCSAMFPDNHTQERDRRFSAWLRGE